MLRAKEKSILFKIRVLKDHAAFDVLFSEHAKALQRFLKSKLPTTADAEDAFTTTAYRFWNYLSASEVESVSGLLFTIARSVVAEFYRSRKEETVPLEEFNGSTNERLDEKIDAAEQARKILRECDESTREILIMRFMEGWRVKDIAEHLGKSENAVSMTIHRAVKRIRLNITKYDE